MGRLCHLDSTIEWSANDECGVVWFVSASSAQAKRVKREVKVCKGGVMFKLLVRSEK